MFALIVLVLVACGGDVSSSRDTLANVSLNSAPVFISESNIISQENVAEVTTISAGDADNIDLYFDITGGVDADNFQIDSSSGELRFRKAPDFEKPQDSNTNNTYIVVISVSDSVNTTRQTFAVSVIDALLTVEVPTGYIKTLKFNWLAVKGVTHYRLFVSSDGEFGYTQVGTDITTTHTNVTLPAHLTDWMNSRYLVEGYNAQGRVFRSDPKEIHSVMLDSIGYIKASNAGVGDYFGASMALSADGLTLVVGAPREGSAVTGIDGEQGDNTSMEAGAVYVFARSGSMWAQQTYIKASNTDAADFFGASMALSADGQTLVVGAPYEDSAATGIDGEQGDNTAYGAGAVYVYTHAGSMWTQQAYIKASNTDAGDNFGSCVALSADGQTLAVGAPNEDSAATGVDGEQGDNTAYGGAGAVYVYTRAESMWTQQAYIKASNTDAGDNFGSCVALSADGQTLAVGAPYEDSAAAGIDGEQGDNTAERAGAVYVFTRAETEWMQQAYIKASDTEEWGYFANSVALSADGQTLVIGAPYEASSATGVDGNQLDNSAYGAGAVYAYTRAGSVWTQQAYIKASNTDGAYTDGANNDFFGDTFGSSVALNANGQTLVVGAPQEASAATGVAGDQDDNSAAGAGAVYVYTRVGLAWTQQTYIKAPNTDGVNDSLVDGDSFGSSVTLSADGQTLVIGAWGEDSAATGIDGDPQDNTANAAGAVYVY